MNACAVLLSALLAVVSGAGSAPKWARVDPTYTLQADGFAAADGGASQGDHYLLSEEGLSDFVLSWEMTRVHPVSGQDRAIVVWSVDADPKNRRAIFVSGLVPDVGKPHRFRLVVRAGEVQLTVDGRAAGGAVEYGSPPKAGRVGFLHYYRYDYTYRNVKLVHLGEMATTAPEKPSARVTPAGVVELAWREPEDLAGLLRYAVERDAAAACAHPERLGVTGAARFADRSAASGRRLFYRVRALGPNDVPGPVSPALAVQVTKAKPPSPPRDVCALRRIDGSVRVSWSVPTESRAAWSAVRRRGKEKRLRADAQGLLDPAPGAGSYTVLVGDPDGKRPAEATVKATPSAPPVAASARFPTDHPRLVMTRAELARLKAAGADGPARDFIRGLMQRAEGLAARPVALPDVSDTKHWTLAREFHDLALAALISGNEQWADHARAIVLAYAEKYPTLPWHNRRSRMLTQSSLFEAMWAVPLVQGYDLLLGTGRVTPEERRRVEGEFLPLVVANFRVDDYERDTRISDLHLRCYNFQAWHLAVTGLVGLLLGDADLVEWTLDSRYGYRHLLAHDIRDDGLFWERSLGYHGFVISALTNLTEAAWRCNLNLYAVEAADRVFKDEDSNYVVDGDNGPKRFARMFEAPFYFAFPDLSNAVVADSGRGPLTAGYEWRVAARRMPDPKLDWLVARAERPAAAAWRGVEDISGRVALSYDDENLYVRAWVADDVVRNDHAQPAEAWAGDLVWLSLGARPGTPNGYDFIYGLTPGVPGKLPPLAVQFNHPGSTEARRSAGRIAVSPLPGPPPGYYLEAAIPLAEVGLRPVGAMKVGGEICLYDGDRTSGSAIKEKMVGWNCRANRYDPAEGGAFLFGGASGAGVLGVPRQTVTVDGQPDTPPPSDTAAIGAPNHVMTDGSAAPGLGALLLQLEAGRAPDMKSGAPGGDLRASSRTRKGLRRPAGRSAEGSEHLISSQVAHRFCNNGRFAWGSSLFPSSGFALLRANSELPWRQPPETLCVNFNYGAYGGGHGHPDRLSIVLYALGRQWIPDFGSCDYDSALKGQWTAQTVSHNTVVVDGVSQYPTGDRDVTWPVDTPQHKAMGRLGFFHSDPMLRTAGASCDTVYDGVSLQRTVALAGPYCLDLYQVNGKARHTYDYVLHIDGEPEALPGLAPVEGALGQKCGYQLIDHVQRGNAEAGWVGEWKAKEGSLHVSLLPGAPTEMIAGRSLTTAPDRTMPLLIARREAESTAFAVVLAPVPPGGSPPVLGEAALQGDGRAVRVTHTLGDDLLVLSPRASWSVDGMAGDARAALRRQKGPDRALSLAAFTRFAAYGLSFRATKPADLYLTRSGSGRWRALNPGTESVEVSTGSGWTRLSPGEARELPREESGL